MCYWAHSGKESKLVCQQTKKTHARTTLTSILYLVHTQVLIIKPLWAIISSRYRKNWIRTNCYIVFYCQLCAPNHDSKRCFITNLSDFRTSVFHYPLFIFQLFSTFHVPTCPIFPARIFAHFMPPLFTPPNFNSTHFNSTTLFPGIFIWRYLFLFILFSFTMFAFILPIFALILFSQTLVLHVCKF